MLTINKQDVSNLLLLDYLSSLHTVTEKLRFLENKYQSSWDIFVTRLHANHEENMQQWDDYIEWKAYLKLAEELNNKIAEIKHGHFEIA